jgi:phage shock protein C
MTASSELNPQPIIEGPHASRRLFCSRSNRVFAGVCGGFAEYFGADPTAVRLLAVLVAIFTAIFPMLFMYLVAAIVIPLRDAGVDGVAVPGAAAAAGQGGLIVGALLVGLGVLALANETLRIDWNLLWPVGLIALGGALVLATQQRR